VDWVQLCHPGEAGVKLIGELSVYADFPTACQDIFDEGFNKPFMFVNDTIFLTLLISQPIISESRT
jgi:hypothetical protein